MLSSIVFFTVLMLVPLGICIYTVNFGRWLHSRRQILGSVSAFTLAALSLAAIGAVLWTVIV